MKSVIPITTLFLEIGDVLTRPKLTLVGFRIDEGDVHGSR